MGEYDANATDEEMAAFIALNTTEIKNEYLLPSLTVTKDFGDKYSLLTSWSKSVVRPNFLETAGVSFIDPVTQDVAGSIKYLRAEDVNGAYDRNTPGIINDFVSLQDSQITSYDFNLSRRDSGFLRFIGLSFFYKDIKDHIDRVGYSSFDPNNVEGVLSDQTNRAIDTTWVNFEKASSVGVEFDFDLALTKVVSFGGNVSRIRSEITPFEGYTAIGNSRLPEADISYYDIPTFSGQANWLSNLNLGFSSDSLDASCNFVYNYTGQYLVRGGLKSSNPDVQGLPNVMQEARHTLDIVLSKGFDHWGGGRSTFKFKIGNVLNASANQVYEDLNLEPFREVNPGRDYGVSYSLEF